MVGAPKLPPAPPSSTETLLEPWSATARSGSLSPLKSPTATAKGVSPAGKSVGAPKLPPVLPSSTETLPVKMLATARSGSWSPLKSPAATEKGKVKSPVGKLVAAPKVPPAPPSSTETLSENWLATARSGSLSPSKSPTATETGPSPVPMLVGPLKLTWVGAASASVGPVTRPTALGTRSRAATRLEPIRTARRRDRMWPPGAGGTGAAPALSGKRRRVTSHAYRHQVPLDAVRSRHHSQAIAPGAIGSGRTGPYRPDQGFRVRPLYRLIQNPAKAAIARRSLPTAATHVLIDQQHPLLPGRL